ncbi:hypothetical protein B0T26DRAFT_872265 [Lasiosphaeria miniovina]|uniref:Uncharacterized protein n=1 Tax=Lasiosphaeria miniovina TaxID=1954250 RepID=A0AA40ALF1_9PEZI|nr:uncharacterized protein B0T26DRAFT_872265 [Lasiosphaeria miniovina]KAK0717945.1 hypothetical protein B0T26DRAFT_872265 [Lasiosphaeria miniovina]
MRDTFADSGLQSLQPQGGKDAAFILKHETEVIEQLVTAFSENGPYLHLPLMELDPDLAKWDLEDFKPPAPLPRFNDLDNAARSPISAPLAIYHNGLHIGHTMCYTFRIVCPTAACKKPQEYIQVSGNPRKRFFPRIFEYCKKDKTWPCCNTEEKYQESAISALAELANKHSLNAQSPVLDEVGKFCATTARGYLGRILEPRCRAALEAWENGLNEHEEREALPAHGNCLAWLIQPPEELETVLKHLKRCAAGISRKAKELGELLMRMENTWKMEVGQLEKEAKSLGLEGEQALAHISNGLVDFGWRHASCIFLPIKAIYGSFMLFHNIEAPHSGRQMEDLVREALGLEQSIDLALSERWAITWKAKK